MPAGSALNDALRLLAGRELSVHEIRGRLLDRGHAAEAVEDALTELQASGALDDRRVASAYVRTAVDVKGRGRTRILHELRARGIAKDVAAEAVADVFSDFDERTLVARALRKKLRGRPHPGSPAEYARLYQHLMRQGFSTAVVADVLRKMRGESGDLP